ncbi:hypothetical protein ACTFIY_004986 [Dictyostelium cf. discoideum]
MVSYVTCYSTNNLYCGALCNCYSTNNLYCGVLVFFSFESLTLTDIEWTIENEGCKVIKSQVKGETLIIKTVNRVVEKFDTIMELDNITLIVHSNKERREQILVIENQKENQDENQKEKQNQSENKPAPTEGQEKKNHQNPTITSTSNDKTFMALEETAQIAIEESLENKEELTRMENEINTQLTNNQKT